MSIQITIGVEVLMCKHRSHLFATHENANDKTCPICAKEELQRSLKNTQNDFDNLDEEVHQLKKQVAALKGVITKLKRKP
jgi:peptidoglycan hydrolase CwlO-like protein